MAKSRKTTGLGVSSAGFRNSGLWHATRVLDKGAGTLPRLPESSLCIPN